MARVFIGLGSNLGDKRQQIQAALEWLDSHEQIDLVRHAEPIETPPWGVEDQPSFLNAVAEVRTALAPEALLLASPPLQAVVGRMRSVGRIARRRDWRIGHPQVDEGVCEKQLAWHLDQC